MSEDKILRKPDPEVFASDVDLRRKNQATVETYMVCTGQARLRRHELFAEDGEGGLWTSDKNEPIVTKGRERLAEHAKWSLRCFPDWEWYNIEIFATHDPNRFWVECDGRGTIDFDGYPTGFYENHFMHSFELADGKILRNREFMNPLRQMAALEIDVPQISREGIPL
ncbi:SnoaL-like domain-containing protein [Flexivirga sp. ID2601S]|uniref:SnoaL-like domain-containing protein n=1 Tax=Flexivirga aerilata TaxID=1656889 RepID=A0A849AEX1_9MICO|nr:PhzA/PhzB family protein [Flexivirga aerilata]NNG39404.1 SnoaL-like domain-containing protein [Flexivirga aerilata]